MLTITEQTWQQLIAEAQTTIDRLNERCVGEYAMAAGADRTEGRQSLPEPPDLARAKSQFFNLLQWLPFVDWH